MVVPTAPPLGLTAGAPPPSTATSTPSFDPRARVRSSEARDRRDARQRLAAEAEGAEIGEIGEARDLARGVALEASTASSALMPSPSSVTRTSVVPPCSTSTTMRVAPASSAFSTSSFTTLAGRSTTSPAAIWLASSAGSR